MFSKSQKSWEGAEQEKNGQIKGMPLLTEVSREKREGEKQKN